MQSHVGIDFLFIFLLGLIFFFYFIFIIIVNCFDRRTYCLFKKRKKFEIYIIFFIAVEASKSQ